MRDSLYQRWGGIITFFLISRVIVLGLAVWSVRIFKPRVPQWEASTTSWRITNEALRLDSASFNWLVAPWLRWDTVHYVKIAVAGLDARDGSAAFAPLYPWLMRGANAITGGNLLFLGLLISNGCALAALLLFYEEGKILFASEHAAQYALMLIFIYPFGFFLVAAYTESLFLLLALLTLRLGRQEHWGWAAFTASLATLTRFQGVTLSAVLMGQYLSLAWSHGLLLRWPQREAWKDIARAAFLGAIPFGTLAGYSVFVFVRTAQWPAQVLWNNWHIKMVWPWQGVWDFFGRIGTHTLYLTDWVDAVSLVFFVVAIWYGARRLPLSLTVYNVLMLGMILSRTNVPNLATSAGRYLLGIFPVFWLAGYGLAVHRRLGLILGAWCVVLQLLFVVAFVNWLWVG